MLRISALALAACATLAAAPASAQTGDAPGVIYGGVSGGYHDLGTDAPGDNGGGILGGVVGYDVSLSPTVVAGVEGNFHFGEGAIDSDYGVAGRLGYRFPSGGVAYVRAGYQWVNLDVGNLSGIDGVDDDALIIGDTVDDYLVGVGGEFPLSNPNMRVRVGVDTVGFDSVRPTAGLLFRF